MGSTIDALIAQGPRPVQVDPNAVANRIITLRQAMQQQQMGQEQIEAAQQENQMRAYNMDKIRALNGAYQAALQVDPTTGRATINRDSLANALKQSGHGEAIPGIMQQVNEYEMSDANLQAKRTEVAKAEAEHAGTLGASVRSAGYDPQLFMTLMTDAVRRQHVEPQMVAPMLGQVQQALQQDPTGAAAKQVVQRFSDQLIAGSEKQRELDAAAQTAQARQTTAQTGADKFALEKPGLAVKAQADAAIGNATLKNPNLLTPDQQRQADQATATLEEIKKRDAQTIASENTRNAIAQQEANIRQSTFDATLGAGLDANGKPLSDDEKKRIALQDPVAVGISKYLSPDANTRTALGKSTMTHVFWLDPAHDGTQFAARNKTAQDYSPAGASGKMFISMDNALAHLQMVSDAGRALDNNDFPALNRIANELGYHFGGSARQVYDGIVGIVAPELIKGTIGEAGGEGERGDMRGTLTSDNNTATREGTLGAIATIYGKRMARMRSAYQQQMNRAMPMQLSDESQAVLQRYSGGGAAKLPDGGGKTLDPATATQFLQAAGGDKAKARQLATQNHWRLQ